MASKEKQTQVKDISTYKGYNVEWLRRTEDHPDYHLVAEYEALLNEK